ncbi:phage major capsid protein, partial [bacterium]|nr:phage major capsid protein [bacterium]
VQNPLARGVIELFPRTSPVLERLPFFTVNGQAYVYNQEKTLPGVGFRGINETYDESTGVVNPQVERLAALGGKCKVDRLLVLTQGSQNNLRAIHDSMKVKSIALEFTGKFFNGDNSVRPKEFDGLKKRITGNQIITKSSPTSGGDVLTLDLLDELIDSVVGGPDVLFMNKTMRRKVNTLVRAAGQAIETVSNSFGRQLTAYAGVPIAPIEQDHEENDILPFTEDNPGGGTAASTSLYAVRFGTVQYVSGLQARQMDVIDQGLQDVFYQTLVDWYCGIGVFHPKAAARLRGIKNA